MSALKSVISILVIGLVGCAPKQRDFGSAGAGGTTGAGGAQSSSTGTGGASTTTTGSSSSSATTGGAGGMSSAGAGGSTATSGAAGGSSTGTASGGAGGADGGVVSVTLVQNDGPVDDTYNFGTMQNAGQGFVLAADSTITALDIRGSKGMSSSSGHFSVEIRSASIDGPIVWSEDFSIDALGPYSVTPELRELLISSPPMLSGGAVPYFIRMNAGGGGNQNDELRWSYVKSNSYPGGSMYGGAMEVPNADHNFRVRGHSP